MIAWFARNPVAANLFMISLILAGIAGFFRVEREVFPSGSFNFAAVSVVWPGASPREIEEQIIFRIEEAISDVDGVEHVDATAREGVASITIEGADELDSSKFLNEIKARVDGISTLPADAFPPVVRQITAQGTAVFLALYGDLSERELHRLARQLRNEASRIPGGSPLVQVQGGLNEEVSIEVSEESLRRYGLTFDDVARAIRGTSVTLAGGQVKTDTGNVQVAARNLADTREDFENIVIRQSPDGAVIRVKDVATVIDGFEDRKVKREINGKSALTIAIQAPETLNIVELSRAVKKWVAATNKRLDGDATLQIWFDTADIYYERMQLVSSNALFGLILVLILLMMFLRPTVAFWVSWGIVVAFAASFILMPFAGVSLNILSLFAFLLVSGIVVDDAIVIGESIHEEIEKGGKGVDAAILGTQLVAKPVLFSVLTTIVAFLPWLFISGGTSQFTKHISYTIIFALSFSLIEAYFCLPAHLAHLKKQNKESRAYKLTGFFADGLVRFADRTYQPWLRFAIRWRYPTAAFFIVMFFLSVALLSQGWVAFKFQPAIAGPFISINVRFPEGTPYQRSLEVFDQIEAAIENLKKTSKTKDGSDYVLNSFINASEGSVVSQLTIADQKKRKESSEEVARKFRDLIGAIPDAEDIAIDFTINDGGADLSFGVESTDLEALRLATIDMQSYLRTLPGVFDVRNSLQSATPELRIELKPGAQRFGLTLADVSRQVRQAFFGEEAQRLPRDGQDVRVMVRYPAEARSSLETIDRMRIRTADGREVPLAAVADLSFAPSYKRIDRRDRERSAQVTAELREGVDRAAINQMFFREFLPEWQRRHPGVNLQQRGDAEAQGEFLAEFFGLSGLALLAMYVLLAIPLGSYWQPLLIMAAIPFGFMGAAFGHFLWGMDFALFSFFGVAAAAGVVVNDNIVLLDSVNKMRAKGAGAVEALVRSGVGRFRPIFLTTVTTFAGLFPIMWEQSVNAEFLKPTVIALTMGVVFALFVTLLFVPAMYCIGADIARFYRWAWTGDAQTGLDLEFAGLRPKFEAEAIARFLPGGSARRRYI
jgi:multidrug efflux pump subunit AcrB